jgi:hypothetical protein
MPEQPHWGRFFAGLGLIALLLVAAFSAVAWSLWSSHERAARARADLCQTQNRTREAVQSVLDLAQATSLANPKLTVAQKQTATAFYEKARARLRPIGC